MRHGNQIGLAMAIVLIAGNSFAEVPQAFAKQARTISSQAASIGVPPIPSSLRRCVSDGGTCSLIW